MNNTCFNNKKGKNMSEIRLQKFLSQAGVCSRRQAEEYIEKGRIKINNKIARIGRQSGHK